MALTPAQRRRRNQRRNRNRGAGAGPAPNPLTGQQGFHLPQVQLPPFLMELLQDGSEFMPRSEGALRAEAQQMASASTAPGMAQIQSMLAGGTKTINELTGEIQHRMEPIAGQVANTYGAAQQATQGYETAMANRLQSLGQGTAADLQAQFSQAGMPSDTASLAQGVGNEAAAASQASFALGGSALQRLAAEGAAQGAHAAELPGIAQLGGQAALAALQREAASQAAGISAQAPGIAMDAYRSLRSSEDARMDANRQSKTQLAGMLMDWNQNLQNLAFQNYATDLGFFGDRKQAQDSAQQFLADMGYKYDALAQDESQFGRSLTQRQMEEQAQDQEDAAKAVQKGRQNKQDYLNTWSGKAQTRAEQLSKGRKVTTQPKKGDLLGEAKTSYKPYTWQQAYNLLNRYLTPAWENEGRRYALKDKRMDRMIRQALRAAGFKNQQEARVTGEGSGNL